MAEKKPWLTPYHYCSNNPINRIDPDGREDVITLFGKDEKDQVFIKSAQNYNTKVGDNNFTVFAHGNSKGIEYQDNDGNKKFTRTSEDINSVLSNASPEWKASMENGEEMAVTFYVCNMATEDDGKPIAQKISEDFDNLTVTAANGYSTTVNLGPFGAYEVGVKNNDNNNNNGSMVTYVKGEKITQEGRNYPTLFYIINSLFNSEK